MDGPTALDEAMDERRKVLRKRWNVIAREAGMSTQHLNRIRAGKVTLTDFAAAGIDRALDWQTGHAWRIYQDAGGLPADDQAPTPDPAVELRDEVERGIWAMTEVPEELRLSFIGQYREKQREQGKLPEVG